MNNDDIKTASPLDLMLHMAQKVAQMATESHDGTEMELVERRANLAISAHQLAYDAHRAMKKSDILDGNQFVALIDTGATDPDEFIKTLRENYNPGNPDDFRVNLTEVIQNAHNEDPDVDSEQAVETLLAVLKSTCTALSEFVGIDLYDELPKPQLEDLQRLISSLSKNAKMSDSSPDESEVER